MSVTSSERAKTVFIAAMERSPEQREQYLDQTCGSDDALKQRVRKLLAAHRIADQVLPRPPAAAGSSLGHALDAEHPRDVAGTRIGRYTLSRMIAVGGMGVVYEAQQDNPHRSVALKVMKAGITTKSVLRRFEFETQVLGRLEHPNIAHIHDAGVHDGEFGPVPYFAMELIHNAKTIIEYADEKSLDSAARLQLFVRVCRAVHHGHQKGVIHRDLKPSNILVDAGGEPKIIDFGVARATDSDASLTTGHTEFGKVIGTVAYMSPEQAGGRMDELDTRSDVYSLGVLLFELLSGSLPYALEERAILDAVRIIQQEEPAALGSIRAALRGDIETIVAKAIEKEPARRYQSAHELAADIRRYLNNEPIMARAATVRYQLTKFARRNKALVGGAAATVAALIIGVIGTTTFALRAAEQRTLAEQREQEALREQGRTLDALNGSREARQAAEVQRRIAEAVNDFLTTDLLAKVWPSPETGGGKDVLMRDVLDAAAEQLEKKSRVGGRFEEMPLVEASIRVTLGWTCRGLGEYAAAIAHLERARDLRLPELGEEHLDTLDSMNKLAVVYRQQALYDLAEPLHLRTLEIQERVRGEEHPDTLLSMHNVAVLYQKQGRYDESEPLYVKTLEIQKRVLGPEHFRTLMSMGNLATLYDKQGRYDEAEALCAKTLHISKRVLGEEHEDTLACMNNLAMLYAKQGRYDEAEPLHVKTLEIQKRVLGEERRETLGSITNLGLLYLSMKRFDDARAMFERSLPIKRRVLWTGHPWTRIAMRGLARAYDGLDRGEDSLPLWRELQEFQLAQVEDPDASTQMLNAAAWDLLTNEHAELRDPARALPLAQRAVDKVGGVNPGILDTLALAQFMTGDTSAAIATEKKALSLLPPDAPGRGDYEAALARFEAALNQPDTARSPTPSPSRSPSAATEPPK